MLLPSLKILVRMEIIDGKMFHGEKWEIITGISWMILTPSEVTKVFQCQACSILEIRRASLSMSVGQMIRLLVKYQKLIIAPMISCCGQPRNGTPWQWIKAILPCIFIMIFPLKIQTANIQSRKRVEMNFNDLYGKKWRREWIEINKIMGIIGTWLTWQELAWPWESTYHRNS